MKKHVLSADGNHARTTVNDVHHDSVTSVDESLAQIAAGKDIYTAQWYWEKSHFPADEPWYLHPVPMADKQLEMDEYDRFFKVYHDDIRRGRIIPAWSK